MQRSAALRRAAEIALRGCFRVEPNPLVGCVLVSNERIVGEGWHQYWGGPHAEAVALEAAGRRAKGATAYVTLEPCATRGKRPACTSALIRAGVARVVYADADGDGAKVLRAAGVEVRQGRSSFPDLIARFDPARKLPWVIAKWAMTLDGHIATRSGDSRWISSKESRTWAQREFRGRVDAILVGAGTVRSDDPSLGARAGGRQPLRVVLCGKRPLPAGARVLGPGTLLAVPEGFDARRAQGADLLVCGRKGRVDPRRLLEALHARGVGRLLVEGGGEVLGSFFQRGLVDQALVFVAPKIAGGGRPAVAGPGRKRMDQAAALLEATRREIGPDLVIEGYVDPRRPPSRR